ncbi:PKD-like domain-containing protein [Flavobacterium caeni]|uniref:Ig-like domain-containing protein n=1 Tax=Flavobacterium caeni TaxID=490189 RepID=A0A1G5F7C1_9FLAO|nr:PKD-like domain-containing protein [Flavobacterium caeni]SCY35094.1 hypothetical protein SAMN02927903_01197 [Flavobacterium caeni]
MKHFYFTLSNGFSFVKKTKLNDTFSMSKFGTIWSGLTLFLFLIFAPQAQAQIAGPNDTSNGFTSGGAGTGWSFANRIEADDFNYSTCGLNSNSLSEYLRGTQYGFTIPAGATINGIVLRIMRQSSSTGGGNSIDDVSVRLMKNGVAVGNNYANGADWPGTMTGQNYGGAADLWGTTWTPAEINAGNFGAELRVEAEGSNRTASVDFMQITVYYTSVPTVTGFTPNNGCAGATATSVVITGTNFLGATAVSFNGTNATYTINSATQITATLPAGATSGPISVTTPSGTGTSASNFTVNPVPTVSPITGTLTVCPAATTPLSNATAGGVWTSGSPSIATVNSISGMVLGVSPGNAIITYTVTGNGCTNATTATVTVTAPTSVSGPSSVCIGSTIQMLPSSGGTWVSNNPAAASIDMNTGVVTGLVLGTSTFTFTDATTSCSSTTAAVSVHELPSVTGHPTSQSVCSNSSVSFSVTASGSGITYQWFRGATQLNNGGAISGATSSTLTINPVALGDAATDYYCVVSGNCSPSATSNTATLTVTERVVITAQPVANQSLCTGNTANFSVSATGAGLTYQWYNGGTQLVDGGNISGATSPTLSIANLTTGDASALYHCIVGGLAPCTSVTSNNSVLVVNEGPAITAEPTATQTVCSGDAVSFSVSATGGSLVYQWYKGASPVANGGSISGANTPTLNINPTVPSDSDANYHCVVINGCATPAVSINAALTVNEKPFIFNYSVATCSEVAFAVVPSTGVPTVATVVPAGTTYSWPAPVVTGGMTGGSAESGQLGISQTLTNPTTTAQTATYTVTPTSGTSGACVGASFTVTVTVNPTPFINNITDSVCSEENLVVTPANGGGNLIPAGTTYTWSTPSVTGGLTGGSGGNNQPAINILLTNPTNTPQTANYNVTATSGSCTGSVFSFSVTVNPKPTVAADTPTQTVCSGSAFAPIGLSNPNNVAGTITYNWTRTNTGNLTGLAAAGSGTPITGTLTNTTNTAQTTTFSIIATSEDGCISDPVTVDVVVNPNPTVAATPASQTVCPGVNITTINFSNPNNVTGPVTYSWTRDNTVNLTGIAASGSGTNISGTFTNNTLVQQSTTFTISATAAGCGTSTTTVTVIVNPQPDVAATPASQTVCAGLPISAIVLSNPNAIPGTTYSWTRTNAANTPGIAGSGTASTISGTLTNPTGVDQTTTFTIYAIRAFCQSAPVTVDVIVRPAPLAVATPATQGVCTGATANIVFSTSNGLAGTTYSWTRTNVDVTGIPMSGTGDISGTVSNITSVNQTATFTVLATAPNGCSRTITATLTVYPTMSTPGIEDSQVVCQGSRPTTFFITTPVTGGSGAYTYQWQSSTTSDTGPWTNIGGATGATYQPPTTNGATPNTWYQVLVTSCGQTVTSNAVSVVVANNSNFSFSIDFGGGTVCSGANFNPRIYSAHGGGAYIRYSWIGNPAYITPSSGGPLPQDTSQPWWLFGAYLSEGTLPLTVVNNTNANVTTTISITPNIYDADTNAFICSLTPQTTTVTIRPNPTVTATAPSPLICSGTSAAINLTSNLSPTTQIIYSWTRSVNANVISSMPINGANSPTIAVNGSYTIPDVLTNNSAVNQNVTYFITATSVNGPTQCPGSMQAQIVITVAPQLTPGVVSANQTICNGGDPVAFTETTPAAGSALSYQWQFSTTSATGPWTDIGGATGVTYDAPGPITQTTWFIRVVSNSVAGIPCSVANTTPIQVSVNNVAPGAVVGGHTICSGGNPPMLTSSAPGSGNGTITYQWQSNTTGCGDTFTNIGGATGFQYDPPAGLLATTYYRRMTTSTLNGSPCVAYSNCVVVYVNDVTPGTVGSDETLCGNNPSAFTEIVPATGSGTLTYQWQRNTVGCGSTFTNISGATSATYDAPAGLVVTTYYRRITTSTLNGVSCTAISNCITVTPNSVTAGTIATNRTVCMGGDPAAFTSTAAGTGTGLTYQWQISTVSGTGPWTDIAGETGDTYDAPGPINVVTYFRRLAIATVNSTACSAGSNFVTVFVNDVTAPTIAGDQSVCSQDPVAFTVTTPATFVGTPSYQWQSSTVGCASGWTNIIGATGATYDPPVVAQTTYYRVIATSTLNSTPCSAISNCVTITSNAKTWNGSVSSDWNVAGNWTPNGVPTSTSCVVVPNTITDPIIDGSGFDAYAFSTTVLAGGNLTVNPGNSITVTDVVQVNPTGGLSVLNNASLVQINNVANIGNIHMQRITQPMYRYDYTYWGSPVTLASNYTLAMLSPATLADKYFYWNPTNGGGNGNWVMTSSSTVMNPNRGYIVRAPQTYSTNPALTQAYTANFIGVPNNGNINVPIAIGTMAPGLFNDKLNLIGNPYPSGVDADAFLSHPTNVPLIDGTIYFWTHHSPPSAAYPNPFYGNYVYNYTAGDYATYTLMGGTGTTPTGYGGPAPNGYIAAGQGFFVKGLANGNAVFTNTMRDKDNNSDFFRMSQTEKQRVWLNLANEQGGFSQTLVGYAEGATLGYDRGFEGSAFGGNFVSFYSVLEDEQMVTIQGRPLPFDSSDQVPLGYNATAANNYTIGIDHFDDAFDGQNIYLEDKLLNIIHDLKANPYTFASEVGRFNDRFVLRYTDGLLGVDRPDQVIGCVAFIANQTLTVQASEAIKKIEVFDLTGKLIRTFEPKNTSRLFESEFIQAQGVYLAKIKLENGSIVTAKLMNNR